MHRIVACGIVELGLIFSCAELSAQEPTGPASGLVQIGVGPVSQTIGVTLLGEVPPPIFSPLVRDLFKQMVSDKTTPARRQEIIEQHPKLAAELIGALTDELSTGTAEEYRRIPWLWRIALQTGKRNDIDEIRAVLNETIPQPNQPLHDWRAVVIGGGIINGLSQEGLWPLPRIKEILKGEGALTMRWDMMLSEAAKLVEDEKIPASTRYDALRIVALDRWDRRKGQLEKYLILGPHPGLQLGAVNGLVDIDEPAAAAQLIRSLPHLSDHGRELALSGLLRGEARQQAFLDALENGSIKVNWLHAEQRTGLLKISDDTLRQRAEKILR